MRERGSESGGKYHGVGCSLDAVRVDDSGAGEALEHRHGVERAPIARLSYRGHGDYALQAPRRIGFAALLDRAVASRRPGK